MGLGRKSGVADGLECTERIAVVSDRFASAMNFE
jgi:hypothetical protein